MVLSCQTRALFSLAATIIPLCQKLERPLSKMTAHWPPTEGITSVVALMDNLLKPLLLGAGLSVSILQRSAVEFACAEQALPRRPARELSAVPSRS